MIEVAIRLSIFGIDVYNYAFCKKNQEITPLKGGRTYEKAYKF